MKVKLGHMGGPQSNMTGVLVRRLSHRHREERHVKSEQPIPVGHRGSPQDETNSADTLILGF